MKTGQKMNKSFALKKPRFELGYSVRSNLLQFPCFSETRGFTMKKLKMHQILDEKNLWSLIKFDYKILKDVGIRGKVCNKTSIYEKC